MRCRPAIHHASTMAAAAPDAARSLLRMVATAIVLLVAVGASTVLHLAAAAPDAVHQHGVTVNVNQRQVIVNNGMVQVTLSAPQGHITDVRYNNGDQNLLYYTDGANTAGYWDVLWDSPRSGRPAMLNMLDGSELKVVSSSQEKVELSFRSIYNPSLPNSIRLNIDKRFVMLRGSSGFYCYAILEHANGYPALTVDEARITFKLNMAMFNYMAISDDIQRYMPSIDDRVAPHCAPLAYKEAVLLVDPLEPQFKGEVDDKYQYSLDNKDNAVHGWISSTNHMGFWVITPSNEFKSGGPMKRELTSHVGPTSMAVFLGTHYTGIDIMLNLGDGEYWKKVLGPVFIYLNSNNGSNIRALWDDAKAQARAEAGKWPYTFPESPDFAKAGDRGTVTGTLLVRDAFPIKQVPAVTAFVGLAAPGGQPGSWATQCKGYQFWTRAASTGRFSFGGVRAGTYSLYAWVPGVLGDYVRTSTVNVTAGGAAVGLGDLVFVPPRSGPTLWEIGVPDRTAAEFFVPDADPRYASKVFVGKDRYRQYGLWERYAELHPAGNDLVFTVGQSDYSKDWFFAHVTRMNGTVSTPTTRQIRFNLDHVVANGTYTLRIALAAAQMSKLLVRVNGRAAREAVMSTPGFGLGNAIARHGIHGGVQWSFEFPIRGYLLGQGENSISITQTRALGPFVGVMYDYLRLEGPPPA